MLAIIGIGGGEWALLTLVALATPLGLACLAFWIWMLVHDIQNNRLSDGEKAGWVLAIALVHFAGAFLYFFIGRPKARLTALPTT